MVGSFLGWGEGLLQKPWTCFWSAASTGRQSAALTLAVQAHFLGRVRLGASTEAGGCLSKSSHFPARCLSGLGLWFFFGPERQEAVESHGPQVEEKMDQRLPGVGLSDLPRWRDELKVEISDV